MAKKNTTRPSAEDMIQMRLTAEDVKRRRPRVIEIQGKKYHLHPITNIIDERIAGLAFDALRYEREMKSKGTSAFRMKRLNRKIRKIPAKIAAYYKLGWWVHILPFSWSLCWRLYYRRSEEISATINTVCVTGDDKDFFSANSEVIKYLLALSMRGVGNSVSQMLERMESAESMLDEDASPKKEEDNKSSASLKKATPAKR